MRAFQTGEVVDTDFYRTLRSNRKSVKEQTEVCEQEIPRASERRIIHGNPEHFNPELLLPGAILELKIY